LINAHGRFQSRSYGLLVLGYLSFSCWILLLDGLEVVVQVMLISSSRFLFVPLCALGGLCLWNDNAHGRFQSRSYGLLVLGYPSFSCWILLLDGLEVVVWVMLISSSCFLFAPLCVLGGLCLWNDVLTNVLPV
jgi:hypothetical protein